MRISIVTPTLNAARFLDNCARSVSLERSADVEIEHLIVDGGSTDQTLDIARNYGCAIVQGHDDGIFDAANRGYEAASGEVVGFLGADDELATGAARTIRDWFEKRDTEWAVGSLRWIDGEGKSLGDIGPPPAWLTKKIYASLGWNCIHHLSTYVTPAFFRRLGGFDTSFRYSGDYDLFARALGLEPYCRLRGTIGHFRRHGENASMSRDPRKAREDELVAARYGPRSAAVRRRNKLMLQLWLNGTNPRWATGKLISARSKRSPAESLG